MTDVALSRPPQGAPPRASLARLDGAGLETLMRADGIAARWSVAEALPLEVGSDPARLFGVDVMRHNQPVDVHRESKVPTDEGRSWYGKKRVGSRKEFKLEPDMRRQGVRLLENQFTGGGEYRSSDITVGDVSGRVLDTMGRPTSQRDGGSVIEFASRHDARRAGTVLAQLQQRSMGLFGPDADDAPHHIAALGNIEVGYLPWPASVSRQIPEGTFSHLSDGSQALATEGAYFDNLHPDLREVIGDGARATKLGPGKKILIGLLPKLVS